MAATSLDVFSGAHGLLSEDLIGVDHLHNADERTSAHRLCAVVFCRPFAVPEAERLRARAEAAPSWHKHGFRRSVAGSAIGTPLTSQNTPVPPSV
jgi:hypothetical protein